MTRSALLKKLDAMLAAMEEEIYGQHVLISAIKYLDGGPRGCDDLENRGMRAKAIGIMLRKLSKPTRAQLERDRATFWGR